MLEIDKNWVKKLAGETIYKRGYEYYKNDNVKDIDIAFENHQGNKMLNINSKVLSSNANDVYTVNIKLGDENNNVKLNCNCKYWGVFCKHSAATLIKLIEEKDEILSEFKDKEDKSFLNEIKSNVVKENITREKIYLNTKYKLHLENIDTYAISLEIRIGEDKLYVVKNIKDFLEGILKDESIYFGKSFTFDPSIHKFKEEDRAILKFLMEIYEVQNKLEEFAETHTYTGINNLKFIKGKKVYLTESNVIKLFKILRDNTISLKILDNDDLEDVEILREDFSLNFTIRSEKDNIYLMQNSQLSIPLTSSGKFVFYENKIYELTDKFIKNYNPFFKAFIKNNNSEISIHNKYSEDIASYVLPALKKVTENVKVDESLKEKFYEEKLVPLIYLDKVQGHTTANIIFQYGDININPLNKKKDKRKENKVLIRNLKKEEEILDLFKLYGFYRKESIYVLENEEMILAFLLECMAKLQCLGQVYCSEAFKKMKVYDASNYKSSVRLNDEDLLEFSFSIEGVDKKELKYIFKSIREKKRYYRLKEGSFISLVDNSINHVAKLMNHLNISPTQLEKDSVVISRYNALYLYNSLRDNGIDFIEENEKFKDFVYKIKNVEDVNCEVPYNLSTIMRPYQKFGFKWLKNLAYCGLGGILSDEMGLGKTLQTIAFIKSEVDEAKDKMPSLVVCPTSLVYNWQDEINKFQPNLRCLVISGSREEREELIKLIPYTDVVITSYALIRRDIVEYENINFRYCFLDEAQNIKNGDSLSAHAVKCINAKSKFALTGTPIENSVKELWSIFDFIMPGYLFSGTKFSQKYEVPIVKNKNEEALNDLLKKIKPFILRRLKKNVIKELPPKIEHNIMVDMSDKQKKLYASFIQQVKEEVNEEISKNGFNKSKLKILALITRLRQICCDPSTFIEDFDGESGKIDALLNIADNCVNEGHKILIFSQFTSVLKNISKKFDEINIKHLYLDGSTKAKDRGELVKEFNEGDAKIFLISLKAGGTGLNLTSADVVIHFDPWWNPAVEDQASDRAHRIGQRKTVEVIRLIARGTIEEKIYNIQEKKKQLIEKVIDKNVGEEVLLSSLDKEEILNLFN